MELRISAPTAGLVADEIEAFGFRFGAKAYPTTVRFGQLLQTRVKANASGRPGPRAITGDYRRSIDLEIRGFGGAVTAEVGTNAPQGRRLELGFFGVDALGRHYRQPPYPHFGPAFDQTAPEFAAAIEALLAEDR